MFTLCFSSDFYLKGTLFINDSPDLFLGDSNGLIQ